MSTCASATRQRVIVRDQRQRRSIHCKPGAEPQESDCPGNQALKARFNPAGDFSIPNIPLVEIYAMPAKQLSVFLLRHREYPLAQANFLLSSSLEFTPVRRHFPLKVAPLSRSIS